MAAIPELDERVTDWALFAFAVGLGGLTFGFLWHTHGEVLDAVDLAVGVVACLALWWRRDHPLAVYLVAFGASALSPLAQGAGLVAVCTAGTRTRGRALIAVVVTAVVCSAVFPVVNPKAGEILTIGFPAFLLTIIAFGLGLYLRARHELVASLRERAERLEADQQRSVEQAREAERRRIAREMHDVLAHRLSLLSVHAGALEFRPDAATAEIAQAAAVIRTSAAAALDDLRQVITVLREDSDAADGPPQPGFGELDDLLLQSRAAGMPLQSRIDVPDAGELPAALGRTVYRVIQEGLTNARKHAPGAQVTVTVTAEGHTLIAEVISRRPVNAGPVNGGPGAVAEAAGAGAGLIGLAERLELAGGGLEHGQNAIGDFVLRATIPRPP
jgi:signal transduction histidine kinase